LNPAHPLKKSLVLLWRLELTGLLQNLTLAVTFFGEFRFEAAGKGKGI
jgi:hypothetical protein